jgi:hypothetical protein
MAEAATPASTPKAKTSDSDLALSSDAGKDRTKASRPDHGKTPKYLEDQAKAQEAARKDPYGTTPAQWRGDTPKIEGTPAVYDGLNPHLDDNEHIVGGTLPPV